MPSNNPGTNNVHKNYVPEAYRGVRMSPGPHLAIVKNVNDTTRSGRLEVYVPSFGGDPEDPKGWFTVRYASPFAGHTRTPGAYAADKNKDNSFRSSEQTYGMWMVPPDIGNTVLIIFADSSPDKGFWFACVLDNLPHAMIPNIPGSGDASGFDDSNIGSTVLKRTVLTAPGLTLNLPTSEFNRYSTDETIFLGKEKPPLHEYQSAIYLQQGLHADPIRGPSKGSSQREAPSAIFGISTPGRPINDPKDDLNFTSSQGKVATKDTLSAVMGRKGGHVFYMDDGDVVGQGEQIRLRSAGGHQILMDDASKVLSIHNANGSVWMEFAPSGQIHVYSQGGVNIRSKGDINLHSDNNIKINAKGELRLAGNKAVKVEGALTTLSAQQLKIGSKGRIDLKSDGGQLNVDVSGSMSFKSGDTAILQSKGEFHINNPSAPAKTNNIKMPKGLTTYKHADVFYSGGGGYWAPRDGAVQGTIVNILPTHEPWDRTSGVKEGAAASAEAIEAPENVNTGPPPPQVDPTELRRTNSGGTTTGRKLDSNGYPATSGTGWDTLKGGYQEVTLPNGVTRTLDNADKNFGKYANTSYGNLTGDAWVAYMAATAGWENAGKYTFSSSNPTHFGAFQFGTEALVSAGVLTRAAIGQTYSTIAANPGLYFNANNPYGLTGWNEFFTNPDVQNQIFLSYTNGNYQAALRAGVITADSSPEDVAGALAVLHLLGSGDGPKWFAGTLDPSKAADKFGTSATIRYNQMITSINYYLGRR